MNKIILILAISISIFSSCKSPEEKEMDKKKEDSIAKENSKGTYSDAIKKAEKEMLASKNYNAILAVATLKAYNDFIVTFPNDSNVVEYLFISADLAQGSRNYEQAASYLEIILAEHKTYKKYADACFLAAYIYDTYLEEVNHGGDRAKQLYQFIITNYPLTSYAEQAKVLTNYVGIPDSTMIKDIINKGGK